MRPIFSRSPTHGNVRSAVNYLRILSHDRRTGEGSWIDDRDSVIFIGDSGTGQTMLATALAICTCQQGRRVRFTTLAGLATSCKTEGRRELTRVVGRPHRACRP